MITLLFSAFHIVLYYFIYYTHLSSLQLQTNLWASHFSFFNFLWTSTTPVNIFYYTFPAYYEKNMNSYIVKYRSSSFFTYLTVFTFSNFCFLIAILVSCFPYKSSTFPLFISCISFFYKNFVLAAAPDKAPHYFFHIISFVFLYVFYYLLYILFPINLLTRIIYITTIFLVSIITFLSILFLKLLIPLSMGLLFLTSMLPISSFFGARFFVSSFGCPHVLPFI